MISKTFLSIFVALLVPQVVVGNPLFCPDPSPEYVAVYDAEIHVKAIPSERAEKLLTIPAPAHPNFCVVVSGIASFGVSGSATTASVENRGDQIDIRLVSNRGVGMDLTVSVYTR